MARIRSIKPEFFFDEELASLGDTVRLFFIGLWTHADKSGRLEDRPAMLKAQIMPYQKFDADAALEKLSPKFIIRYAIQDKKYIQIVHFEKHQRPHHTESDSEIPPCNGELTVNTRLETAGGGKGKEEGKEGKGGNESPRLLFDLWNRCAEGTGMALAVEFGNDRVSKCRLRLVERPLKKWEAIFNRMAKTPFLNGENDRGWRATFDWIISNSGNAVKVLEGKYDGNGNGSKPSNQTPSFSSVPDLEKV